MKLEVGMAINMMATPMNAGHPSRLYNDMKAKAIFMKRWETCQQQHHGVRILVEWDEITLAWNGPLAIMRA
jgi:hypothetical protein